MTFQIDTTGRVECGASFQPLGWAIWSDLTPFAQGYVEALFADTAESLNAARIAARLPLRRIAFRDLAPETLARIIADCEQDQVYDEDPNDGKVFWEDRQRSALPVFPPLTVQLNNDGKVIFA